MSGTSSWSLAPYLRVSNATEAIQWYMRVFDGKEKERYAMPDGKIGHAELDIHGNMLCLADESASDASRPKSFNDVPITLYAIVPDVDAVFNRAIAQGATIDRPLADQEYGHRNGGFIDPYGHIWYVSTPLKRSST